MDNLKRLEDKNTYVAGGSVIGMNLATVCSLLIYTINVSKKKRPEQTKFLKELKKLKKDSLEIIEKDTKILEELMISYKQRKNNKSLYQKKVIRATKYSIKVIEKCYKIKDILKEIETIGNPLFISDYNICHYYLEASIKSSYENYIINYNSIDNNNIKKELSNRAELIMNNNQ